MNGLKRIPTIATAVAAALTAGAAGAELAPPRLGDVHKWVCQGDHAESYVTKVLAIENGKIRMEEQTDGVVGFMEKPAGVTGLNVFLRRDPGDGSKELTQEFDVEDFAPYAKLEPGSSFSAEVEESDGDRRWTYKYSVEIGEPETITNDLIGEVSVVPVTEKRWIYRQEYSSTLKIMLQPERALPVSWTFSDPKGKSECDLYLTYQKKIKN